MAAATKKQKDTARPLAVTLVLDRPVNAANEDKLIRLVTRLVDAGIAHLAIIYEGAAHPASWGFDLRPLRRVEIGPGSTSQHFSSDRFVLTLLPPASGKAVVAAAARSLATKGQGQVTVDRLEASINDIAGRAPDLVIVTGGAPNLRGSLTWQAAYGEFVFCERPWTELAGSDLDHALKEFAARGRRFGGLA